MRSLALVLLLTVSALAQSSEINIPYKTFVLDNGLTVIVHEDHKTPVVALNVWYHVGSKNEKAGKTGFAHLFEHLMFGGSENFKGRYIDAMERIGATDLNGTTNNDRTNYFETVPTSAFDRALALESDRMGHFSGAIVKDTLDLQRGVVQNEKRQGDNQPYGVTEELITKATYPAAHPYSWTVIGSMEDLNAASLSDVKEWFATYYGPNNATLSIAGDIDFDTVKAKVTKYFGDIPAGPPVSHQEVWVAKRTGTQRERVEDRVPEARVYMVWNVPQYGAQDSDYLDLAADVLTNGKSSRLYKRLVYDDQIATNVVSFNASNEIGGQFYIFANARPGVELGKVEAVIRQELARFLKEGPSPEELERAKTQREANLLRGLERVGGFGGKSDVLAISQVFLGSPDAYKTSLRHYRELTPQLMKDTAARWLSDGDYVLSVYPFPDHKTLTTGVDRSKLPDLAIPKDPKMPKLERATLGNGLKVILAERHDLPLVNFWLATEAGYAADHGAIPGTASLTSALFTGGTKRRTALAISDETQALGADIGARAGVDFNTFTLSALKSKLDPSLDLFSDLILNPAFPEADFQRQQQLQISRIQEEKSEPTLMAMRLFPPLAFGEKSPYGVPLTGTGTETSVARISRAEVLKFYKTWIHPGNSTLVIVGDTTLAEMMPKLERYFGNWEKAAVPAKKFDSAPSVSKSIVYLIDKPGAQQSSIIAGSIAPPKTNEQEVSIHTMNNILGGTFGSRINMNLREDKHWSYGTFSILVNTSSQRPFLTIAPVQTDKTEESLVELNKEFHEIVQQRPISEAELDKSKVNQTLKVAGSRETSEAVGDAILDIVESKLPDDYYDKYPSRVRALRVADVMDSAKTLIHPDQLVWIIVGDRAKIEPGIRKLNLGEVHILDADGNPR